jgi:hypothetical protein
MIVLQGMTGSLLLGHVQSTPATLANMPQYWKHSRQQVQMVTLGHGSGPTKQPVGQVNQPPDHISPVPRGSGIMTPSGFEIFSYLLLGFHVLA